MMMWHKKIVKLSILLILLVTTFFGCEQKNDLRNTILLGTIAGPETELVEVAKQVAKQKYNLDIHIIPFNDYLDLNIALAKGEINANMFQHMPYLNQVIKQHKLDITNLGELFIFPVGIYSDKYKTIDDLKKLPNHAIVAIPFDASNKARSLLLLQQANLIKLNPNIKKKNFTLNDIIENPYKLKFLSLDPAYMIRLLPELDLAVINTNYAIMGRLYPNIDALITEKENSNYANILAVRTEEKNQEKYQRLLKSLRSPEVVAKAKNLFHNQVFVAW